LKNSNASGTGAPAAIGFAVDHPASAFENTCSAASVELKHDLGTQHPPDITSRVPLAQFSPVYE
jgi:hypothetical protein